jgi:hypothetical protein
MSGPTASESPVKSSTDSAKTAEPAAPVKDLEDLWARILEAVGRVSAFTRSYLIEAHPVAFARNVFTIGFDPEFEDHLGLVDNVKTRSLLHTKLKELGCGDAQVKFIKAEAPPGRVKIAPDHPAAPAPGSSPPASAPSSLPSPSEALGGEPTKEKTASTVANKQDFRNDPLIKEALEVFKGTIVEVRA